MGLRIYAVQVWFFERQAARAAAPTLPGEAVSREFEAYWRFEGKYLLRL